MSVVSTPAVVLRTYRYSETSKIVRLATGDYRVQSAMAKGVLRPRSPFGAALETLSEGVAQMYHKETRELQTLAAFDVIQLRRDLAGDLGRFAGAAALSETMLKMAPPAPLPAAYDARSEEHTSELQSRGHLVCRLLLEKKKRPTARQSTATRRVLLA